MAKTFMAETFDLIVRGGEVVNHTGRGLADIGVRGGKIARIGDHGWAPVVEYLQAPEPDVRLLDVNPVVPERTAVGFTHGQLIHQQSHGDEVTILQAVADLANFAWYGHVHGVNQFAYRHGGKDIIRREAAPITAIADRFNPGNRLAFHE